MLTVLKWLFYLVVLVAVVIVGGSFFLPGEANVRRSIEIAAPPEKIFAIVGDLKNFNEFSPWAALDPNIAYTYEGPESGVGQKMSWSSQNPNVGSGSQTVTDHVPPSHMETALDFGDMGGGSAAFDIEPTTTGSRVTWSFHSALDGIAQRWFGLMFDRWIGADYEKGLALLKTKAEQP